MGNGDQYDVTLAKAALVAYRDAVANLDRLPAGIAIARGARGALSRGRARCYDPARPGTGPAGDGVLRSRELGVSNEGVPAPKRRPPRHLVAWAMIALLSGCATALDRSPHAPTRTAAGPAPGSSRPTENAMVETLLLAATRVNTFSGTAPLTNASGFFFERDGRLWLVTSRHVFRDEPTAHRPDRVEIDLHNDPDDMARSVAFSVPLYRYGAPLWRQGGAYRTRCGNPGTAMGMEERRACLPGLL